MYKKYMNDDKNCNKIIKKDKERTKKDEDLKVTVKIDLLSEFSLAMNRSSQQCKIRSQSFSIKFFLLSEVFPWLRFFFNSLPKIFFFFLFTRDLLFLFSKPASSSEFPLFFFYDFFF